MRKPLALLCLALCLLLPFCAHAEEELLSNGGFELVSSSGDPTGWLEKAYVTQEGYSRLKVTDEQAHSGTYSAVIENASLNDARFVTTVKVEPESLYRLSGYVLVESMSETGNGANLAVENIYSFSDCFTDTNGEWEYVEWFGETGEDQTEVTIGVRVGGYSAESVGKAYFDDLSMVKVDSVPTGVVASLWYTLRSSSLTVTQVASDDTSEKSTVLIIVCALFFALLYLFSRPYLPRNMKQSNYVVGALMLVALAVRVVMAVAIKGYEVDVNCFTAWSLTMAQVGPTQFYEQISFCDYPPGYMLVLWPIGLLLQLGAAQSTQLTLLMVKLVPILCDLIGALFLYRFAKKRIPAMGAVFIALLYAFNPAVLVSGAAWGQADSVLALLLMLTALFAMEKRWRYALPLFFLAVLMKPQALLFAPIGLMWLVLCLLNKEQKGQGKEVGIGAIASVVVIAAIVIPFSIGNEPTWIIDLYMNTVSGYDRATINTANLYYLLGENWTPITASIPRALSIVTAVLSALFVLWRALWQKAHQSIYDRIILALGGVLCVYNIVLAIAGASFSLYGYALMAFVYLLCLTLMARDRRAEALPFYMAFALIGVYVLGVMMHERYLLVALPLLLMAYVATRDRRLLVLCVGFSMTTFVNTAIILDNSILYGSAQGHLNNDTQFVNICLCIANLLLMGYAGWIGLSGLRETNPEAETDAEAAEKKPAMPPSYQAMLLHPKSASMGLRPRDWLVMGVTSVLYAVLAFANLGSTVAPQTAWVSTSSDEQVVFELPEEQAFRVLYYCGVSYNPFSISVSNDGVHWSAAFPCQMRQGLCYKWIYVQQTETIDGEVQYPSSESEATSLWLTGKYLRVNAESAGLNLWEIVARGEDGNNIPLTLYSHTGGRPDLLDEPKPAENLIDEMDTCVGEPSLFNGMYFDEIYHARSAYHNLNNEAPYETTHPPLGKLMIAAGIAIFGMTPFGWRFTGTLMGVLMLPALYLLGLQLTKKRSVATVSMLAFALDLMHYTQTRIATIDSFPVLFIILGILCMVRYMQTDLLALSEGETPRVLLTKAFWKSLIPLGLCGLFMGLGIASKWIGLYSAVGLAILFFTAVARQYRASSVAFQYGFAPEEGEDELAPPDRARVHNAQEFTLKRIFATCGFCVLFFIVVPCIIYYLSYIPYLAPTGPVTIKRLIEAQVGMYDYHSTPGLGADHPFNSQWWQWPFILKPMWFARDTYEPAGFDATIMCMGNPWVFYVGAVCMVAVMVWCVLKYVRFRGSLELRHGDGDLTLPVLVIGLLAQFLPWILVPRSMYMYHYFASVPFIILATAWMLSRIRNDKWRHIVTIVYLVGAAVFFVMFFPYASGWLTPTAWLDAMKWFPRIYY